MDMTFPMQRTTLNDLEKRQENRIYDLASALWDIGGPIPLGINYQRQSGLELVLRQIKLCNIFIFGMAHCPASDKFRQKRRFIRAVTGQW